MPKKMSEKKTLPIERIMEFAGRSWGDHWTELEETSLKVVLENSDENQRKLLLQVFLEGWRRAQLTNAASMIDFNKEDWGVDTYYLKLPPL